MTIYETGSGGDYAISMQDELFQQFYIAMFGGNIEQNTKSQYLENEERSDYWGNSLIFRTQQGKQFNSNTERVLRDVVLNSQGRLKILNAVNQDLDYLKKIGNFTVEVYFEGVNRISIEIKMNNTKSLFIFDNAKKELIIEKRI